jgi:archaellum biogenesis ATPase FlaH
MYRLDDFKRLGIYCEKPVAEECELNGGKIILRSKLSDKICKLLDEPGGSSHGGDFSRQDSAVITALLSAGHSSEDALATFKSSARGRHALERKAGHYEDYLKRTVEKAVGYLKSKKGSDKVSINFAKEKKNSEGFGLIISMGHEVEVEKIRWIWPGYIPAGKLTIIAGDPGMGKSTIVCDLVSRISRGTFLPSGNRGVTGMSLIASAEDAASDTIVPRLISAGADLQKVGIIREVRDGDDAEDTHFLSFPRDLDLLRQTLIDRGCRVLIIDPLNAFLEKGTDTYKDQDMRRVLHPLESIAEESGTSILVVAHLNKKEDTSTLYRIGGSIGFIGAARSVLAVARMDDDTRVLYSLKNNVAVRPPSLSYETKQVRRVSGNGHGTWLGEQVVNSSGIRWLGEVDFNPLSKTANKTGGKCDEEASEFLRVVLQEAGEMESSQIFREARIAGISKPSLTKLKLELGIKAVKKHDAWYWKWPEVSQ